MTFECEPGTLTEPKLDSHPRRWVCPCLSLGVENFSDRILELNGRAHRARRRSIACIASPAAIWLSADQHRPDSPACSARPTRELDGVHRDARSSFEPDSVTIYQMELPHNTTISARPAQGAGGSSPSPWRAGPRKRRWVDEAFERARARRAITSAVLHRRPATQ